MTSQKTIERCRKERDDFKVANAQLLENNVILAAKNVKLRSENKNLCVQIKKDNDDVRRLTVEKEQCTLKCKSIISEKDVELQKKQQYINDLHGIVWHLKNSFSCDTYEFVEAPGGFKLVLGFGSKK